MTRRIDLGVAVSEDLRKRLTEHSARAGQPLDDVVESALDAFLASEESSDGQRIDLDRRLKTNMDRFDALYRRLAQ